MHDLLDRYEIPVMETSRLKLRFKLNLIVADSENMGIGINGDLPWRLRIEMAHFSRMTNRTKDSTKQNAVILGRKTWEAIPEKKRPLEGWINLLLSQQNLILGPNVLVCSSLETALQRLQEPPLAESVESAWIIGGSSVYKFKQLARILFHTLRRSRLHSVRSVARELQEIPRSDIVIEMGTESFGGKEVIEGKIEGQIEVTRRLGRRRKKMLDDLGDRRGYCHLKEKALDRIKWRNCFGRDCGPVV
ncbi:hypothetical protein B7P43_G16863 [Cryptotermes secundus]|uniref:dihydrofolate reductase n=1 Tax=Cryptotermes secundus TaxID=105785 RepID=A0A2J7PTE3_9NEOP|nr:hypothetical protein B7P43_G16863 [Cryptotermes secundus]